MLTAYRLLPLFFAGYLTSCHTVQPTDMSAMTTKAPSAKTSTAKDNATVAELPNLAVLCNPPYVAHLVLAPPPKTGTERAEPIVLITRKEFNERLKRSPLWDSLQNKRVRNGSYGNSYYFTTLIDIVRSVSYIRVYSQIDGHKWRESQRFTQFNYGIGSVYKRSKYGHQLLPQERWEMIETITLVIDDRAKATDIVDTLYQQYMDKVNHEQFLSDGKTIHTYLEYDGKYFALWGAKLKGHDNPICNYELLNGLIIN